jgi:hypothetical protein
MPQRLHQRHRDLSDFIRKYEVVTVARISTPSTSIDVTEYVVGKMVEKDGARAAVTASGR